MIYEYKMFIDGKWVSAENGEKFVVYNPTTAEVVAKVARGGKKEAQQAIDAAKEAFERGEWREKTLAERARIIFKLTDMFEKKQEYFAEVEAKDVGKPVKYSLNYDFPFLIDNMRYFAGASRAMTGTPVMNYNGESINYIRREPIGVVAAFIPWNFPLSNIAWKIIPALLMGNSVIVKPSSKALVSVLEFTHLAEKLNLPKGVLNVVTGPGEIVGKELGVSGKVDMITFSGDAKTGRRIMEEAATNFKKLHFEFKGKSPMIILKDADLKKAAQNAVFGAFENAGQEATAVTRVYIHKKLKEKFVRMVVAETKKLNINDPLDRKTDIGPLTSAQQRDKVEGYVQSAVQEGAKIAYGGERIQGGIFEKGFFMKPTVLTNVTDEMGVCNEDITGPVLSIIGYKDLRQAIDGANCVPFSLAASVWGADIKIIDGIIDKLRFGTVWVNDHGELISEMPFGGSRKSGIGRDLSIYTFDNYSETKHVYIKI